MSPAAAHPAATRTAARTLGELVLAAAELHRGTALEYPLSGTDPAGAGVHLDASGDSTATSYPAAGRPPAAARASISYPQLGEQAREIARGLIAVGVERGEGVAILSRTRVEWTLVDCGALCAGAVVVPVYSTNSPEECAYVLAHSGARVVCCEDAAQVEKVAKVRERCPQLELVVVLEGEAQGAITLGELRARAAEVPPEAVEARVGEVAGEEVATLVYTSGTTGPPKGCVLTHANLLATARMYGESLQLDDTHVLLQFLPLAHVLARVAQFVVLEVGACTAFAGSDPSRLLEELAAIRPTHFPAVPRVYEKIHAAVAGTAQDGGGARRALFEWSLTQAAKVRRARRAGRRAGLIPVVGAQVGDRLVLGRVRALFGGRLQLALVGAAPVARELLEFFDACGVPVMEGYGMTESCAAATLNTPGGLRYGTVGRPLPGTEVAVADDGEILIRGPHVFAGYHRNEEATRAVLSDGWLCSGDLGRIDADGYLTVTGRKKELIITSSGKNISPGNVENELRETRWIAEAVVYGDRRPYLVAMVTLDHDEVEKLAGQLHLPADLPTLAGDERVRAAIQQTIDEANRRLAKIEQVKRFAILDHDLTQAEGELTPTLKVKRAVVYDRYGELFERMYDGEARG